MEAKPLFIERMKKLLGKEFDIFMKTNEKISSKYIRCNTLKISPSKLKERLSERGWKIKQPYKEYPEIMLVESELLPGELGNNELHLLGYFYVQELTSMMPIIALKLSPKDIFLDLCSAPGSKTTQAAALMENSGILMANDSSMGRMSVLSANLERCGVSNTIVIRNDAVILCEKLKKLGMKFDKILLDVPCSGEGNIRKDEKTLKMWNIKTIQNLSRIQKKMLASTISLLKDGGEIIYSTCTHAPEECEAVVSFAIEKLKLKIAKLNLPIKYRKGITKWKDEEFVKGIEQCCRIYPQDNDAEGFFLARLRK